MSWSLFSLSESGRACSVRPSPSIRQFSLVLVPRGERFVAVSVSGTHILRLMERIASMWGRMSSSKMREDWKNHKRDSVLKCLADVARDGASLYPVEFSVKSRKKISYSLSVFKSPNLHAWCRDQLGPPSACSDLPTYRGDGPFLGLHRTESRIKDLDVCLQIAQAIGHISGLSHAKFAFEGRGSSKIQEFIVARLLPVLVDSICSPKSPSVLKSVVFDIYSCPGSATSVMPDFFRLPSAIPSLEALQILYHGCCLGAEPHASRIASFLRSNRSLKSLRVNFEPESWEQSLATLKTIMDSLSGIVVKGSSRHKGVDNDLVHEKLELTMEIFYALPETYFCKEALRAITTALEYTALGFAVGEFWLSIKANYGFIHLIMRIEHGVIVELSVPQYLILFSNSYGRVVEKVLRLNRGPSVLSLGPLEDDVMSRILGPLIPDRNGHQANTCVSTLKLLNISFPYDAYSSISRMWPDFSFTLAFHKSNLEAVANMMKTNSTVVHLEVTNQWPGLGANRPVYPPEGSLNCPAVAELRGSRLRPGGNLRSFTFYGQELELFERSESAAASASEISGGDVEKQQGSEQRKVQCRSKKIRSEMHVMVKMGRGQFGNWEILPGNHQS